MAGGDDGVGGDAWAMQYYDGERLDVSESIDAVEQNPPSQNRKVAGAEIEKEILRLHTDIPEQQCQDRQRPKSHGFHLLHVPLSRCRITDDRV